MTNTETKMRPARKAAAVIGFVTLLVLIAWLSITIVRNVPGSFASLASLAESVRSFDASSITSNETDETMTPAGEGSALLVVTSDTNVIESGNNVRLSWTDASAQGSFLFTYECQDGVAASIIETDGVRDISCERNYNLGNTNSLTLNITSEKERFADIDYQLAFLATGDDTPQASANAVVTVVNEDIAVTFDEESEVADDIMATESPVAETETVSEETEPDTTAPETVVTTPEAPSPAATTPATPSGVTYEQEFTYTVPVSDPDGRVDLATRFIDTGFISSNSFVSGPLTDLTAGAIQFEVKNLGTKTSAEWTYSVSLPNGNTIESAEQEPLKPNERSLITIGFPLNNVNSHDFVVSIDTTADYTSLNDQFVETVIFN